MVASVPFSNTSQTQVEICVLCPCPQVLINNELDSNSDGNVQTTEMCQLAEKAIEYAVAGRRGHPVDMLEVFESIHRGMPWDNYLANLQNASSKDTMTTISSALHVSQNLLEIPGRRVFGKFRE